MKTILITGASAGIGKHAALDLARRGHHVIATARREDALRGVYEEARRQGGGTLDVLVLDVTREEDVERARERVDVMTHGRGLDVLVNNAGYGHLGPLEMVTGAELRRQFETNVFGLMNVTRAFIPRMRERREGRIVNVSSLSGRMTFPFLGAYGSTKYAVEALSNALRMELAPFGISVSIVEPGAVRTEFAERMSTTTTSDASGGSPYGPLVERAEVFRRNLEAQGASPAVTSNAIAHAALSSRPRVRYVVPFSASLFRAALAILPTRIADAAMRRVTAAPPKKELGEKRRDSAVARPHRPLGRGGETSSSTA